MSAAPARFVVAVGSGKGGVGKSTVALQLGLALTRRGLRVGILDADLYGPDLPLMVGVSREERARMWRLWRQGGLRLRPFERDGLVIVSAGFLIGEGQSLAMAAPLLPAALGQLVGDVDWGSLDVLLVDLPPGTADLHQQLLGVVRLDGAVVVVGSQDVAHLDGRKFVDFLEAAGVPVLGGVENMSGFVCPHCGEPVDVFPRVSEERSVWADGVPLIGRIPIEPTLARSPAAGLPSFDPVAARVLEALEQRADAARSPRRGPKP